MSKANKMGVVQLTILTMVNMMGSGIIMLPTKLAEVGTISIISGLSPPWVRWRWRGRLPSAACSAASPAGWVAMPNMRLVSPATLWRTIPTVCRC